MLEPKQCTDKEGCCCHLHSGDAYAAGGSLAVGIVSLAACILAGVETHSSTDGPAMQILGTTTGADTTGPDPDSAAQPAEEAVESIQE